MSAPESKSFLSSTVVRLRRLAPRLAWLGLLGALALGACGSEGEASNVGSTPDLGEGGGAGAPGSGGESATGGSSTGGTAAVFECDAGEFDADDDESTACVKLRDCAAGEYVKKAGTTKSDRACAACEAGTFSAAKNSSACAAWTECSPGQYVSAAGTDTEDRTCAGCASGTFSATENGSACTPWSDCAAGTYVSSAPSATADRACTPCEEGTHTSGPNESVCLLGDACGAGTVQTAPGTSVAPPVCQACEAGSYCAGGATPAEACSDGKWDHDQNPATECAPKTECVLGERVNVEGDATTDRTCTGCTSGSFSAKENAPACTPWKSCAAGTRVSNTPSAKEDRVCEPCPDDTYTGGPDESVCQPVGACPAGTVQTAPATDTSAPVCEACEAGNYCAGGTEPAEPCAEEDWDEDESPATVCAPKTDCVAGEFLTDDGDATTDRSCSDCADGTYSKDENAPSCTAWTDCPEGYVESQPGTRTTDRTCMLEEWTRQFGAANGDSARGVAVDGSGNVYVAGSKWYAGGSGYSATLRKYGKNGALVWEQLFGGGGDDYGYSVSVDGAGYVYMSGETTGTLPGTASAGGVDAFLVKFDSAGNRLWVRQFGTGTADHAYSVSADGSGNVYVSGALAGDPTFTHGVRAFVSNYDSDGNLRNTREFGTVTNDAHSVSVDRDGNAYVAGYTWGKVPGQSSAGGSDAFVLKQDSDGNVLWSRQLGSSAQDYAYSVSVDESGNAYLVGRTASRMPGSTEDGDAFLSKLDGAGDVLWTRQFWSGSYEWIGNFAVSVAPSGNVYMAGYTWHMLGPAEFGGDDAYVRKYDSTGAELWTRQFGTSGNDYAFGLSAAASGHVYVVGMTNATLPGQTSAGGEDAFVMRMAP